MKEKKKLIIIIGAVVLVVVIAVAVVLFLRRDQGGEEEGPTPIQPPAAYTVGEEISFPALPVMNEEALVYQEETAEAEEPAAEEEASAESEAEEEEAAEEPEEEAVSTAVIYRYEGLTDAVGLISTYAALLSEEDVGFEYVDESFVRADPPDFEAGSGAALLARAAATEGALLSVRLEWSPELCRVTVDNPEGEVTDPPPPEPMTLTNAVDYFASLPPAVLGLEGSTMREYRIYSMDGVVMINEQPCVKMSVYRMSAEGTNEIAGEYFLSADRRQIYKLDADGNMTEVAAVG